MLKGGLLQGSVVQRVDNYIHRINHDGDGWRERHKTKAKQMTLHVQYRFLYISLSSSAKQQREMTKFKVLCRTWTHDSEFFFFCTWSVTSSLQSQLPDCSATLDRLNGLKLSRRSFKCLEVIFKVTFSLALPSWLLKLPYMCTGTQSAGVALEIRSVISSVSYLFLLYLIGLCKLYSGVVFCICSWFHARQVSSI